jgi:hypothetical protein
MGYLRCDACGAKALSAASTCPRCLHVLDLYDVGGRRVALRRCQGCDLMHRVDRPCPACGNVPAISARAWAVRAAAVAGVALTLWVGASLGSGVRGDRVERSTAGGTDGTSRVVASLPAGSVQTPAVVETGSGGPGEPTGSGTPGEPDESAGAPDSTTWQPAVARTWVNVRSDASPDGAVVGVISPDSRAMLGTTRRGWRRITLDELSGWVDPRLFSAANAGG